MTYTILSAKYANEDHSAAVLLTEEAGAVLAGQVDTPDLWAQLAGVEVAAFVEPFDRAAALQRARDVRTPILNALVGIGLAAQATGDTATVAAVLTARQGLLDITKHPTLLAATTDEAFDAAALTLYRQLAAAAPAAVRTAFLGAAS